MSAAFSAPRKLEQEDILAEFCCGEEKIDAWVAKYAKKAAKRGTAIVYATFDEDDACAGLYTLSAHSMDRGTLTGWLVRNAPNQVPVILLGMLAVDRRYTGQGLGSDLLLDAYKRARSAADVIGARALVVDPLDETIVPFYEQYGFERVPGTSRLFARFVQQMR